MNERLKQLRSVLNITLEEFGKKVGITRSAVGRLEKGERNLTEQMIISICREFKVNESWFRTGEGSMFLELPKKTKLLRWLLLC
ncbi:MAG: helix-turn-helix domain-containing protein [Clostridium sp.]